MKLLIIILALGVVVVLFFGVFALKEKNGNQSYLGNLVNTKQQADVDVAKIKCIELCQQDKLNMSEIQFNDGPCLSGQIIPDWVCDVAHNPRQTVDNEEANQCAAYRQGQAHHFVEVNVNCNFIRSY